jgi:hypothetical protein
MARFLRAIALDALQIVSCLLSIDQAMRDRRLSYRYTTVSPPVQAWPPDEIRPADHLQVQLFDDALVVDREGATPAPPTVTGDTPARGPTLCFVGPPGVSKTSLGQSIARGRRFVRMSLEGAREETALDLARVLFSATANTLGTIPRLLREPDGGSRAVGRAEPRARDRHHRPQVARRLAEGQARRHARSSSTTWPSAPPTGGGVLFVEVTTMPDRVRVGHDLASWPPRGHSEREREQVEVET